MLLSFTAGAKVFVFCILGYCKGAEFLLYASAFAAKNTPGIFDSFG
jgi:hypothetical protein